LRRSLCAVFDEPFGVPASNEDTDNFEKDPIYAEISEIKNTTASTTNDQVRNKFEDPIYAELSGIKNTAASTTNDPLRKTARNAITKPDPRSLPKAAKETPIVIKSKSEAEKRRDRVTKCRRKKKEKKALDLLRKEALVADNIRAEGNIARLEQELAQMNQIIAAHQDAQPDFAAILSSFFQ